MDWNLPFAVASDHDNMGIVQKLGSFITELNIQSGSRIWETEGEPRGRGSSYRWDQWAKPADTQQYLRARKWCRLHYNFPSTLPSSLKNLSCINSSPCPETYKEGNSGKCTWPKCHLQSHCRIIFNLIILGGWCYFLHCTDGEIETEEFMNSQSGA